MSIQCDKYECPKHNGDSLCKKEEDYCVFAAGNCSHFLMMEGWFKNGTGQWLPVVGFNPEHNSYKWDGFWHTREYFNILERRTFDQIKEMIR